jgi:hypothetical protein
MTARSCLTNHTFPTTESRWNPRVGIWGVWWTKWFWKQIGLTNRPTTSIFPYTLALRLCSTSVCHQEMAQRIHLTPQCRGSQPRSALPTELLYTVSTVVHNNCKDQPVYIVYGNNLCVCSESCEMHKYCVGKMQLSKDGRGGTHNDQIKLHIILSNTAMIWFGIFVDCNWVDIRWQ